MKNILTVFAMVLAVLIAFRLAGAIVHFFFWPLALIFLGYCLYLYLRSK